MSEQSGESRIEPITLRQWFAGEALAGILADPDSRELMPDELATYAFKIADSMVRESKKEQNRDL